MRIFSAILIIALMATSMIAAKPMQIADLWAMERIVDLQVNPFSGDALIRTKTYNLEQNNSKTDFYLLPSTSAEPIPVLTGISGIGYVKWHKNKLLYSQTKDGQTALFHYDTDTGESIALATFPVPVQNLVVTNDHLAFVVNSPARARGLDDVALFNKTEAQKLSTGVVYDELLYRHWDTWLKNRYNHLYHYDIGSKKTRQVFSGKRNTPPVGLGSSHDIALSINGDMIAFVANPDKLKAASTNNEIYLYNNTTKEIKIISKSPGNDNAPHFSPDNRFIGFLSMARAGFEADKKQFVVYDIRKDRLRTYPLDIDRSISDFVWAPDGKHIFFYADNMGYRSLYVYDTISKKAKVLWDQAFVSKVTTIPGTAELYALNQTFNQPSELYRINTQTGEKTQVTFFNKAITDRITFGDIGTFKFVGADEDTVHGWLITPPNFDASKKYPMVQIIHGGPQGAIGNSFHYRWNMQMFAAPGYVVAAINFHGSTGYGQAFTDRISGDWGGAPFEDIMKGTDYLVANYDFIDSSRVVAAGASYGGFMINWIAGQTDRFNALVNHDGVFDQRSMYGATEELWFPEWEFKGTPYEAPALFEKFSPSNYVANFKTPMLVIHGEMDYRVPVTQGMQAFTALQRMGVPSKFLYFPDENHFVLKPQNAKLWWTTVYDWFETYTK